MQEPENILPDIYLQPGESCLVREPAVLRTVLGSCVGISFWNGRLGIAALCHPMLPTFPTRRNASLAVAGGRRYVDFTIRDLACQFDALGAARSEFEVKLFGGGDVLTVSNADSRPTVGALNCEAALRVLHNEGFSVTASSLGGTSGLQIRFNTLTGDVLLKRLNDTGNASKTHSTRRRASTREANR